MRDEERERLRATFDEDAERYDRARPAYPRALFEELTRLLPLCPGVRVLEIGAGTGQATAGLAATGASVVGLELGGELAAVAARKFAAVPNVSVVHGSFDHWTPSGSPYDVVCAFTAWHWLPPGERVSRAAAALRPGGALVIVSTEHVAGGTESFFADAQACYERWDPATPPGLTLQPSNVVPDDRDELEDSPLFGPVEVYHYEAEWPYTTAEYLDLLLTYSGHRALEPALQRGLLSCLGSLIDERYGGRIAKRYLYQVRIARRG